MNSVKIGTKAQSLGIAKTTVSDGVSARVVLIDPDPQMKFLSYDDGIGKRVEVNQDLLIKYGMKASPVYFFLVARLNTDLKGNISDDSFVVEYLQLANGVYNELADALEESSGYTSFKLTKVSKKQGSNDYSYIKPTASSYQIPQTILDKIATLSQDQISAMWQIVDKSTSMSAAEYDALRSNADEYNFRCAQRASMIQNRTQQYGAPQVASAPQTPQIAAPAYQAPAYQAPVAPAQDMPAFSSPSAPDNFAQQNDFASSDAFDF